MGQVLIVKKERKYSIKEYQNQEVKTVAILTSIGRTCGNAVRIKYISADVEWMCILCFLFRDSKKNTSNVIEKHKTVGIYEIIMLFVLLRPYEKTRLSLYIISHVMNCQNLVSITHYKERWRLFTKYSKAKKKFWKFIGQVFYCWFYCLIK